MVDRIESVVTITEGIRSARGSDSARLGPMAGAIAESTRQRVGDLAQLAAGCAIATLFETEHDMRAAHSRGEFVGNPSAGLPSMTPDRATPTPPVAEDWQRSADAAAAVHQIRNRLQSIIIEAALLKRSAAAGDPAALARIGTLAQDGAGYLELFGELIPCPDLEGTASLGDAIKKLETGMLESDGELNGVAVRCRSEALEELLETLLTKAIPFRGFQATRILRAGTSGDRLEITLELRYDTPFATSSTVTPWMRAQQMARDVGGSLELHSGEPPVVKLHLPKG